MDAKAPRAGRHLLLLAVALAAAAQAGCLWVAAGAAGGAALGYAYCQGKVCQVFNASMDDTFAASRAALTDLGMPILSEGKYALESRTTDGDKVHITMDAQNGKFPADGPLTRVGIRISVFGDHPASLRILDQVGVHLAPAGAVPLGPPTFLSDTPGAAPPPPAAGLPPSTAPPPLAETAPAPRPADPPAK
jgi:hypothetical protein